MLKRIVRLTGTQLFSAGSLGVICFQPGFGLSELDHQFVRFYPRVSHSCY
jgi:hypothetical protein